MKTRYYDAAQADELLRGIRTQLQNTINATLAKVQDGEHPAIKSLKGLDDMVRSIEVGLLSTAVIVDDEQDSEDEDEEEAEVVE